MHGNSANELNDLAGRYGIELAYKDAAGLRREASPESLLEILRMLGAPVEQARDIPDALRERREARWRRRLERITLAWEGQPAELLLHLPSAGSSRRIRGTLELEESGTRQVQLDPRQMPAVDSAALGDARPR